MQVRIKICLLLEPGENQNNLALGTGIDQLKGKL
jgi:hypothetical protein